MATVAIVILNYNGKKYLEKFLPGVVKNSVGHRIVVADNKSTDDSVAFIKENFPSVGLVCLPENGGYSRGYNLALKQIAADYYVLLNSDVEVTEGWVGPVIELMEKDRSIAAAQPKIRSFAEREKFEYAGAAGGYIDILGYPFCRGRLFQSIESDIGQYDDNREVFWATGACLFVRAGAFHSIAGLDESFFAHMEEIDLCWRLQNKDHKIFYCSKSMVYHVGGGTLSKSNPRKTFLNFKNGLSILVKNMPFFTLLWVLPVRLFLDWVAALKFMTTDSFFDGWAVVRAHCSFFWVLPSTLKKRNRIKPNKRSMQHVYRGSTVFDFYIRKVIKIDV